jgi:hypothetical protein
VGAVLQRRSEPALTQKATPFFLLLQEVLALIERRYSELSMTVGRNQFERQRRITLAWWRRKAACKSDPPSNRTEIT